LEVSANVLRRWRREFWQGPANAFSRGPEVLLVGARRVAELERKVGHQALEVDLKGLFASNRGTADAAGADWNPPSAGRSKKK
jgi:transposase-like protein